MCKSLTLWPNVFCGESKQHEFYIYKNCLSCLEQLIYTGLKKLVRPLPTHIAREKDILVQLNYILQSPNQCSKSNNEVDL